VRLALELKTWPAFNPPDAHRLMIRPTAASTIEASRPVEPNRWLMRVAVRLEPLLPGYIPPQGELFAADGGVRERP
jgi:hypothetical protein